MLDIGLLRTLAKLPPEIFTNPSPLFTEFKGAITENLVAQALAAQMTQRLPLIDWLPKLLTL